MDEKIEDLKVEILKAAVEQRSLNPYFGGWDNSVNKIARRIWGRPLYRTYIVSNGTPKIQLDDVPEYRKTYYISLTRTEYELVKHAIETINKVVQQYEQRLSELEQKDEEDCDC